MSLLVAGDSFAEFCGYQNHFTSAYGIEPHQGGNYELMFKHWCELLADDLNIPVESHGIGGAGVSSSCFVAMQQLLKKQYTGVIFFVSHHLRTISNEVVSVDDWKNHLSQYAVVNSDKSLASVYGTEYYRYFSMKHHRDEDPELVDLDVHPVVRHTNLQDLAEDNINDFWEGEQELIYDVSDKQLNYMLTKGTYSYIHDGITSVLALKAFCDAKNIPIVFASCFVSGICEAINDMGVDLKHFEFYQAEAEHDFTVRSDYPSHYDAREHELIYSAFKRQYPDYLEMFQNSQQT